MLTSMWLVLLATILDHVGIERFDHSVADSLGLR